MALFVVVALALGSLGAGRAVLRFGGASAHPPADGVAGLTGLALLTWLAGWFVVAGTYSAVAGWVLLGTGGGALLLGLVGAGPGRAVTTPAGGRVPVGALSVGALALGLLSLTLAITRALAEFKVPIANTWDDLPGYWHFPRLLLESGGFIEPFHARRLGTLGATPFVQGFFWKDYTIAAGGMADALLGQLLIWAGVRAIPNAVSTRPQPAWHGEALALAALLASLTLPRANAMPTLLPMGGAVVLILLTGRLTGADSPAHGSRAASAWNWGWGWGLAWGLVAAWLISLRISNAPFPAVLWLAGALVAALRKDRQQGLQLTVAALATVMGLLPWSLALWRSSGTLLFPLMAGNYHVDGGYSAPLGPAGLVAFVGDCLWTSNVWIIAAIGGLAALRPVVRLRSIQVSAALLVLVAVTAVLGKDLDTFTVYRYITPVLLAGLVFFAGSILVTGTRASDTRASRWWVLQPLLLALGCTLWLVIPIHLHFNGLRILASNVDLVERSAIRAVRDAADVRASGLVVREWPGREEYEKVQAGLPADARVISAAETPFFFRFDHQVIHSLDIPGLVSPPPGMPSFEGPEALAAYLRGLGYTHLVFTPPGAGIGLYSRSQWMAIEEYGGIRWLLNSMPRVLTFMQNEEQLGQSYAVLYRSPTLVVIDLRLPAQSSL